LPIPEHLEEAIDFSALGGMLRVESSLDPDEEVVYASPGCLEEMSAAPGGGGKRRDGLLMLTDRRVLVVLKPGALRKNPNPISFPFEGIANAGPHKTVPNVVVLGSRKGSALDGYYLVLHTGESDMTAILWSRTIIDGAEMNRGRST
jgi:hypothetical protein